MKKLLALMVAVAATVAANAQGTVDFSNFAGRILLNGQSGANALGPTTAAGFTAELLAGTSSSTLSTVALASTTTWFGTQGSSGYFSVGSKALAGLSGTVSAQLRVFDGSSYANASTQKGQSSVFTINLGNPAGVPPTPDGNMNGMTGFTLTLVPEPSTLALGLLAGAGLLGLRRRK